MILRNESPERDNAHYLASNIVTGASDELTSGVSFTPMEKKPAASDGFFTSGNVTSPSAPHSSGP